MCGGVMSKRDKERASKRARSGVGDSGMRNGRAKKWSRSEQEASKK
jgi:hypothetical protein